ncbi:lysylphosphatidylglycerol synthase domain-containing protein [Chitinophaga sedimenti]|uniref:lysylphosphatidylglycerol synthase domain-containing protein n=1 Tax=Chitinophaga sedimenti TaxID=2033606 RepID=UPI00249E4CAA|nr:lysylphosphatidylglycerol synthase domain-containing protein [Chitinophaga sedimenti]
MKPEPGKFRRYFSPRARWREILALLVILLAIFFFRSERKELAAIGPQLQMAQQGWMLAGFTMAFICIVCQAGIYRMSFAAIGLRLPWGTAITLFLKRNFIGVFLPAGSVSALAYAPSQLRHAGFAKAQVHQGSGLFGFAGLLSTFIVGIPVIVFALLNHSIFKNVWIGLVALFAFIAGILWVARSLRGKGKLYNKIVSRFPSAGPALDEVFSANVHAARFGGAILFSLGVELSGILMLLAAMLALGHPASFGAAAMGYVVSILMMVASPFLKGLGAVELSMVYVLERSGYPAAAALSVTILYRVFEFWLPLFCGLLAFAWRGRRFFYRLAPALLTFALGIVNIISAITPPLHTRMRLLHEYLPLSAIHASNMLVLFIGLFLLITAAYLVRGLRSAWITALVFAVISLLGHIGKALDYEEAILAGITLVILLITASQYRFRSSQKWLVVGVKTALVSFVAVGIFAFISFYFIDEVHFGRDFTWQEALLHTGKAFLLMTDETLTPVTAFGHEFVRIIHWLGFITWSFFLFSLLRPGLRAVPEEEGAHDKAARILDSFGDSALDFFKLNKDKFYFFSEDEDGFVAFRVAEGFAVVLEEPVCAPSHKLDLLLEFERYCRRQGLKPAFYRVDESSLLWFARLHKQKLLIGQEGIVDVAKFSLEGRDKNRYVMV